MSRDREDSIREMEEIQKGLESFLEQELKEEQGSRRSTRPTQVFYDIKDEEEEIDDLEEEDDVYEDDAYETDGYESEEDDDDWDSVEHRRRVAARRQAEEEAKKAQKGHAGKEAGMSSGRRSTAEMSAKTSKARNQSSGSTHRRSGEEQAHTPKKKRKKKHGPRRFLWFVAVVAAILILGSYFLMGKLYQKMNYEPIETVTGESMDEDGVVNILLIGNDSRENGEDGRSDAMILLSISKKTHKIYLTSLLRDMYVEIPGYKDNRLNAAYSYGGAELLMETIEQNFDIEVNRYMLVNFEAFANLVEAVGGVDLELSSGEVEYVNGYLWEYNILTGRAEGTDYFSDISDGMRHLNGPQALAYCRNRYMGTDFGRTERQRKVLTAVIKKLPTALLTNSKELFDGLMPNLTTNLTQAECYRLAWMAPKVLTYDIEQITIPQDGTYSDATIREMAVLQVDFDANIAYLKSCLYGDGETASESTEE